jgi:hypothetical protein
MIERLDDIDRRIDEIHEQLGALQKHVAGMLGAPAANESISTLLQVASGDRVLVVGADVGGVVAELRAAASGGPVFQVALNDPLDAIEENAPYDRVVVTEPVHAVAWAWIQHTRRGGAIACVLDPSGLAGQPVVLHRTDGATSGNFLAWAAAPLTPRGPRLRERVERAQPGLAARYGRTTLPLELWRSQVPWYLAVSTAPTELRLAKSADDVTIEALDGSWCQLTDRHDGYRYVVEGGPRDLFAEFVETYGQWMEAGSPSWDRLRLLVTPDRHEVLIDGSDLQWRLPD